MEGFGKFAGKKMGRLPPNFPSVDRSTRHCLRVRAPPCRLRGGWAPEATSFGAAPKRHGDGADGFPAVSHSSRTWAPVEGGSRGRKVSPPCLAGPLLSHQLRTGRTGLRSFRPCCLCCHLRGREFGLLSPGTWVWWPVLQALQVQHTPVARQAQVSPPGCSGFF